jgi:hypothetical protein
VTGMWTRHLSVILAGTRDAGSPWSLLQGHESVLVKKIYDMLVPGWEQAVQKTHPAHAIGNVLRLEDDDDNDNDDDQTDSNRVDTVVWDLAKAAQDDALYSWRTELSFNVIDAPPIAFSLCGLVDFPPPKDIRINMMPFIMGDLCSLPTHVQRYFPMIMSCPTQDCELGAVCYLTIDEGRVEPGMAQRRPGLHIEAPSTTASNTGGAAKFTAAHEHDWGRGTAYSPDELHGGIFMASTVANSTAVYNALVVNRSEADAHGGIEQLRPFVGGPHVIAANEMVWLTDCTPHEALPLQSTDTTYRQYFRLVTSQMSIWFKAHSTANPLVPLPQSVQVIEGNKFV